MKDRKEFLVQLVVTSTHEYTLIARTEEEAVSIAEGFYEDGEFGEVLGASFDSSEAYPTDAIEDEDDEDYE